MLRAVGICLLILILAQAALLAARDTARAQTTLHLDLDKCVEMAVEANTAVIKANYDLDRASNGVLRSASPMIPSLSLQARRATYETAALRPVGDRLVLSDKVYTGTISVTEVVDFGTIMAIFEANAGKHATENYVVSVEHEVAYVARGLYLGVLKARRLLGVREEASELSERQFEKAEALLDVGSAVRSDVLKAQVEVSRNELELISARNALRLAETDLRYFLRVEDGIELELDENIDPGRLDLDLDYALEAAMEHRPDIRSSELWLASAGHGVWRERGGWIPWVAAGWNKNYYSAKLPEGLGGLWDNAEYTWYMAAGIDLFDGLRTFTSVRDAKARRSIAETDLVQMRLDVALEVKRAFYGVEEARQRVKVSEEALEVAEEELRLAEERYRLGGGTMLEQIDSSVSLSEARTSHIEAMYDYLLSLAKLARAVGKD
jgi:outer membrane protein TolC